MPSLVAKRKIEKLKRVPPRDTETPDRTIETPLIDHGERLDYGATTVESSPSQSTTTIPGDKPALLNRALIVIYLNFLSLAFLDMSHFALLPLFYSTPIQSGGLGLDPFNIGIALASFGFVNAIVQVRVLGPLIRKIGPRKMYIMSFPGFLVCFTLYPVMRHLAQIFGRVNNFVIACMIVQLSFQMLIFWSYGIYLHFVVGSSYQFLILSSRFYTSSLGTACIRKWTYRHDHWHRSDVYFCNEIDCSRPCLFALLHILATATCRRQSCILSADRPEFTNYLAFSFPSPTRPLEIETGLRTSDVNLVAILCHVPKIFYEWNRGKYIIQ